MLSVRDVVVSYGRIRALQGVSLEVQPGEWVAVIGPNGAGKTTLVNTISGLLRPEQGEIRFGDRRIDGASPAAVVRRGISQVPEGRQVFGDLSVEDNLRLGAYSRFFRSSWLFDGYPRLWRDRRALQHTLGQVNDLFPRLAACRSRPAGTLSGGEQQMLAIGRALMAQPQLLLVDELSLGLAPLVVRDIVVHLQALRRAGLTLVLIEQNAGLALSLADRVYVLESGRVRAHGTPGALRAQPDLVQAYLGGPRRSADTVHSP